MATKHKPFATGRQFSDWNCRNCGTCKKGYRPRWAEYKCKFELALDRAYCGDGQITAIVAKEIGFLDSEGADLWECPGWIRG